MKNKVIVIAPSLDCLSEREQRIVTEAVADAQRMLDTTDHDKLLEQYKRGMMSGSGDFKWFTPEPKS